MTEFLGWLIFAGLTASIISIFMLASQLRRHMRNTTEMMVRNNEMLLSRLDRLGDPSLAPREPTLGVVLEKRRVNRRSPFHSTGGQTNPAHLPRRRLEDLLST